MFLVFCVSGQWVTRRKARKCGRRGGWEGAEQSFSPGRWVRAAVQSERAARKRRRESFFRPLGARGLSKSTLSVFFLFPPPTPSRHYFHYRSDLELLPRMNLMPLHCLRFGPRPNRCKHEFTQARDQALQGVYYYYYYYYYYKETTTTTTSRKLLLQHCAGS